MIIDGNKLKTRLSYDGECVIVTLIQGTTVVDSYNPDPDQLSKLIDECKDKKKNRITTTRAFDRWVKK